MDLQKMVAEFIGTFTLVFIGCGAAVFTGAMAGGLAGADAIGITGISLAFGLALIGMAYGIGPISGCHINPAVSLGAMVAGRMSIGEMIQYWIAQIAGAFVAAIVLSIIASGSAEWTGGLGANGFGEGYLGQYGFLAAVVFEFVATLLFVIVILGSTSAGTPSAMAGLAIGLTLVAIHLVGIQVTGVSVNPARSIGPAIISGDGARILQLPVFIIAPAAGALVAGLLFRGGFIGAKHPTDDTVA